MPDLGDESHLGRLERVFTRYTDVNLIASAFVWGIGRTSKVTSEVGEIGDVGGSI